METVSGAKKYQRRNTENYGWEINISEGTMCPLST